MDFSYKFSIILIIEDINNIIIRTIDSLINNQTLNFKDNIEIILINLNHSKLNNTLKNYLKSYSNIKFFFEDEFKLGDINGQYVLTIDNGVILSENTLIEAYDLLNKNDDDVLLLLEKSLLINKKLFYHDHDYVIDLFKTPQKIQLNDLLFFVKYDKFIKYFDDFKKVSYINLLEVIDIKKRYLFCKNSYYINQYTDNLKSKNNNLIEDLATYCKILKLFYNNNEVSDYIQYLIIYQLSQSIIDFDFNNLDENVKENILNSLNYLLKNISSDYILNHHYIDKKVKDFLLYLQNNNNYQIRVENKQVNLFINDYLADNLNRHRIWIDLIDINKDKLNISGLLQSYFDNNLVNIKLVSDNGDVYETEYFEYLQDERKNIEILSTKWLYRYNFNISIDVSEIINKKLHFEIDYDNCKVVDKCGVSFRIPAFLSTSSIYSIYGKYMVYFTDDSFILTRYSYKLMLKLELSNLKKIVSDKQEGYISAVILRLIYLLLYPIFRSYEIWLFNDRLTFADDNARCLFEYCQDIDDNIHKYFVISKNSEDYDKLSSQYNNIISFGSFKHKLLYLFCSKHISAFVNEDYSNPFYVGKDFNYRKLFSGLFSFKKYFLQHGVTLGDVSNSIKKYNINLSFLLTSSKIEKESFLKHSYGYDDSIIQVLGLPRYDFLENSNLKKQIVYMPTWRSSLNYDESLFKYSKFYKTVNSLLTNEKLHSFLKDNGYEFIFKPHPELYKYIDLFDLNNVKLTDKSYSSLFNESIMLITDYSSVAFDFAYLKKVILYYQNADDYNYNEGYFNFNTMGFGKVVDNEDNLIDNIKYYIENSCRMDDEYQSRVDNFFKYHDKSNCMRVYQWIKNN